MMSSWQNYHFFNGSVRKAKHIIISVNTQAQGIMQVAMDKSCTVFKVKRH